MHNKEIKVVEEAADGLEHENDIEVNNEDD